MSKFIILTLVLMFVCSSMVLAQAVNPATKQPLNLKCYKGTATVDGNLDEWKGMDAAVVDAKEQVFDGVANWTSSADCSGKFYAMWDNSKIYIAVDAKDDKVVTTKTGGDIWANDCAEVFLATTKSVPAGDHSQHYQFGLTPNNLKWNWCNMDNAGSKDQTYVVVKSSKVTGGYVIEASIEYAQLKQLSFKVDTTIGFNPCLDDCDGDGTARELQITWTGLEAHDQSTGFGRLALTSEIPAAVSASGKIAATWSYIKSIE